jgi:Na+-transporting methylmalonyl-CoA/oxaloacetate decarboxylase gamma subunit
VNTDSIGYILIVAVSGMVIVFIFLTFLSVLMPAIRRLLGDGEAGNARVESEPPGSNGGGPRSSKKDVSPDTTKPEDSERGRPAPATPLWVYAAAAAFLQAEERGAASSSVWVATRPGGYDPWIAAGRADRGGGTRSSA